MNWTIEKYITRWQVRYADGLRSRLVAEVHEEEDAVRIATLLNRHGMMDVALDDPDATPDVA